MTFKKDCEHWVGCDLGGSWHRE